MTGHDIDRVDDRGHKVVAVCVCGNEYAAPNEETARKRWEIHRSIHEARAALRGDKEAAG
jgi:hypothetical protein